MIYLIYEAKYILFIAVLTISYKMLNINRKNSSILSTMLITLILIVISGIRCNFGSDYYSYYRMYNFGNVPKLSLEAIKEHILNEKVQFAYPLLMSITKLNFNSEYAIFMIVAAIIFTLTMMWIHYKSVDRIYSVWIFFMLGMFDINNNILKQGIALSLLIWAFEYFIKGKYKRFFLFSLLATSFHMSSLIIIFIIIISKYIVINRKFLIYIVVGSFLLTFSYNSIVSWIIEIFPPFVRFSEYSISREFSLPFLLSTLCYLGITLYFSVYLLSKKISSDDIIRLNLLICSIPFIIMSFEYIVVLRLCLLGIIQLVLMIPRYCSSIRLNNNRVLVSKAVVILLIFFLISTIVSGNNRYYSYSTILNSTPKMEWTR